MLAIVNEYLGTQAHRTSRSYSRVSKVDLNTEAVSRRCTWKASGEAGAHRLQNRVSVLGYGIRHSVHYTREHQELMGLKGGPGRAGPGQGASKLECTVAGATGE